MIDFIVALEKWSTAERRENSAVIPFLSPIHAKAVAILTGSHDLC
ncbi:MAG TPA: hypothetical protein VFN10_21170 [Thermoanaerobaculia bacterium]|nr:hypothetical protein [Thermoanaerobaculia bacterium]